VIVLVFIGINKQDGKNKKEVVIKPGV